MEFIASRKKHQYLYTNGVLANKKTLELLKTWGLNEIRFNLQATNFSKRVLNNLKSACEYIDTVCIETPIYSQSYRNFLKHKDFILDCGITQINMPELQISPTTLETFKDEGPIYRHRRGYVSPISSRQYVYDLIELAVEEQWNVIINDCSNDTKFFRGVYRSENPDFNTGILYETQFSFLPAEYYLNVIDKYVEDRLII